MPYSDPADKRRANAEWTRKDRAAKRRAASMTLAERIAAGRALAKAAGLKPTAPRKVQPAT